MTEFNTKWFKWVFLTTGLLGTLLFAFTLPPWQVIGVVLLACNLALPIVQKIAKERVEISQAVSVVDRVAPSLPVAEDQAEHTRAAHSLGVAHLAFDLLESMLAAQWKTSLARQVDIASMLWMWTKTAESLQPGISFEDIVYWRRQEIIETDLIRKLIRTHGLPVSRSIEIVYVEEPIGEARGVDTSKEELRWAVENW